MNIMPEEYSLLQSPQREALPAGSAWQEINTRDTLAASLCKYSTVYKQIIEQLKEKHKKPFQP